MKRIQFNDTLYTLACDVVNDTANLRVVIMKEDNTIPTVANVVNNVENIYELEDDEVIAQYTGFTKLVSIASCNEYPLQYNNGEIPFGATIIIELQNVNIQQQINNIYNSVVSIEETQATTDTAITDLGEAVGELADSQTTQDLAIEDLTEAVSELEGV